MYKHATKRKHVHADEYDLYSDLLKIRDAFTDTAKDVKGKAGQAFSNSFDTVKEKSTELQAGVVSYTKDQPLKTIGFAMLAGAVIGFLIRHKD